MLDVRENPNEGVGEISWNIEPFNLTKHSECVGITFKDQNIFRHPAQRLYINKEDALNLIKAIEKTIELGWVK